LLRLRFDLRGFLESIRNMAASGEHEGLAFVNRFD
jgi:hypothetical protein